MLYCSRCGRSYDGVGDWNGVLEAGVLIGVLCPDDQTVSESVEAEINAATLNYSSDDQGRMVGVPKR